MSIRLRVLAAAATAAVQIGNIPAAKAGPWCADYAGEGINCGFYSRQQCLDDIGGIGGVCLRNVSEDTRPSRPAGAQHSRHAGTH
jgi:Protein of unknown function (DUF3551)